MLYITIQGHQTCLSLKDRNKINVKLVNNFFNAGPGQIL